MRRRGQKPFDTVAKAAAVILFAVLMDKSVQAQSAVHAPGKVPTQVADFSGIWTDAEDQEKKFAHLKNFQLPYKPDWAEKYRLIRAKSQRGEHIHDGTSECLPPGMPRFFIFLYPIEILETPGQVTILTEYFNETRRIFTDGRPHPKPDDLEPTFRGHSIGHWEGKTLVVDTVGVRGDTLFSAAGAPHSDQMHIIERIHATGPNNLDWNATVEDPVALTTPFIINAKLKRAPATDEIREYVCEESRNHDVYAPATPDDAPANTPQP
ncbi:MAG: hypothetical protein M3N50_03190 [Pseudomonadota bacterium]|nr:hypothetical protein [Pseudomonadota bacterium]